MDCRLVTLLELGNISLPAGVVNKIHAHVETEDPKGLIFDKVERTTSEKIARVAKIIFSFGIWYYYCNNEYYKALKFNNINNAVLAIKKGASPYLTSEKIMKLVELENSNSLHFAISQCDFPEPISYNHINPYVHPPLKNWGDFGDTIEYWLALNTRKGRLLMEILVKQSQYKPGLNSQLSLYREYLQFCSRSIPCDQKFRVPF